MAARRASVAACGWPYSLSVPDEMSANRGRVTASSASLVLESEP
jgi:hypothetical protein